MWYPFHSFTSIWCLSIPASVFRIFERSAVRSILVSSDPKTSSISSNERPEVYFSLVYASLLGRDTYLAEHEIRVYDEGVVKDGKHQESPPSNVRNSVGSNLAKGKVEQPLACGTDGDSDLTKASWKDLAEIDPEAPH